MVARIVLHIGAHKTGSTALQAHLGSQRVQLVQAGVCYPNTARETSPRLNKHANLYKAAMISPQALESELALLLAEAAQLNCHTLLLSDEGLCEPRFANFAPLLDLAKTHDLHVIGLFRRQDQFIESLWNQYCKQGQEVRPIAGYSRAPLVRRRADYAAILDFWSAAAKVSAANYADAQQEGIAAWFARIAGIPLTGPASRHNPSLGMNAALILSMFNARQQRPSQPVLEILRTDRRRHALGSLLRRKILDDYAACNERLATTYGIRFSDDVPDEPAPPMTSPDPEFLVALLQDLAPDALSTPQPNKS